MVDAVLKLEEGTKFQILAPVVRQRKGTQQKELDAARRAGYARVKIDGNLYDLDEEISLEKNIKHTVEIVVDRLALRKGIRSRLADSLETALALTGGVAEVDVIGGECMTFSQNFACPEHGISISDLSPRLFSFNNPLAPAKNAPALAPLCGWTRIASCLTAAFPSGRVPSRPAAGITPRLCERDVLSWPW